jgi:hypothetical protein
LRQVRVANSIDVIREFFSELPIVAALERFGQLEVETGKVKANRRISLPGREPLEGDANGADLRDRFSVAFGHGFHKYVRREPLKADVRLLALNCGSAKNFIRNAMDGTISESDGRTDHGNVRVYFGKG